jgi:hypothetical protein
MGDVHHGTAAMLPASLAARPARPCPRSHAGITNIGGLCPGARYPGGCDYIAYSADQTCCPEAAALPALLLKPLPFSRPRVMAPPPPPPPPHPQVSQGAPQAELQRGSLAGTCAARGRQPAGAALALRTTCRAAPTPQGPSAPLPKEAPPAPRTSATLPPAASPEQQQQEQQQDASPPPVQHAASPRPEEQGSPSPGGEMQGGNEVPPASPAPGPAISPTTFCVEDLTRSPFRCGAAPASRAGGAAPGSQAWGLRGTMLASTAFTAGRQPAPPVPPPQAHVGRVERHRL